MTARNAQGGRKPLTEGENSVAVTIRLTLEQKNALKALGGAKWVREKIEQAKKSPEE